MRRHGKIAVNPTQVTFDGSPTRTGAGVTVAWPLIAAATVAATFPDGLEVAIGERAIRYGTILVKATSGVHAGKFGPYDSAATDGRQTLTRGNVIIVNTSIHEDEPFVATDQVDAITGGVVWKERLLAGVAGQPTFAALEAALPLLTYANT